MQIVTDVSVKFDRIEQIGKGEGLNSEVWLSNDPQLKCQLAVKIIDKATFWNNNCFAEAQVVYATEHPHVVRVQWAGEDNAKAYIAMPHYKKGSLLGELRAHGPMQLSRLLQMASDVLLGVAHIHSKSYVHLDIKPSNVFFNDHNRALIADFGQCRQIGPGGFVDAPDMYLYTMPPEVILSGRVAATSDIYHVGALLYRAANGENVWDEQLATYPNPEALGEAICKGKSPNRKFFLPHVPKRVRTLIRKALNTDPAERLGSADEFAKHLGRIVPKHDWKPNVKASGEITWRCNSQGSADIAVDLKRSGAKWAVEVHTHNGQSIRAKDKGNLWGSFNSREEALKHLEKVFESL